MRLIMIAAGLVLIAGAACAQDGRGGAAPSGAAARGGNAPPPGAATATIKPGSMEQPHGQNGMGGDFPVPGLYRSNPGNGLYGAAVGDYGGQM